MKFHDTDKLKEEYQKIFEIPFDSKKKWQMSIHENNHERFLVIKGAPEILIKKCKHYQRNGSTHTIDRKYEEDF